MLVEADGLIISANTTARELLSSGKGVRSSSGWITGETAGVTRRLRALIANRPPFADGSASGPVVMLDRSDGEPPLCARIVPLRSPAGGPAAQAAGAVVLIVEREQFAIPSFDAFVCQYGLSRAEARVLQQIIGGKTLLGAAVALRLSKTTVRTHVRHIFCKTGASRQTELLRLFFQRCCRAVEASAERRAEAGIAAGVLPA